MPRIIKYKDYTPIGEYERERNNDTEYRTGSWLSNESITASMPDSKIREALSRYKSIVFILERELLVRASANNAARSPSIQGSRKSLYEACKESKKLSSKGRSVLRVLEKQPELKDKVISMLKEALK